MLRRTCLCLFVLSLCALPALADLPTASSDAKAPGCALAEQEAEAARLLGGSAVEPVPAESSLFFDTATLPAGPIEIHYLVDGEPYVVESADLTAARAPQRDHPSAGLGDDGKAAFALAVPEVVELLTLRPDIIRRFHRMSGEGQRIDVEIHSGSLALARSTFPDLLAASNTLRDQGALPVHLLTEVDGPGAVLPRMPRALPTKNGCGFCTSTSDCDDVGPYDDGKGDCTTCGEYGVCDPGGCVCSSVINDYWTDWFVTNINYVGPWRCIDYSFGPDSRALRAQVTYRRNRIQVTRTCPSCPSCAGCYNTQAVVDYQTQTLYCYIDQYQSCLLGELTIGPWELCP